MRILALALSLSLVIAPQEAFAAALGRTVVPKVSGAPAVAPKLALPPTAIPTLGPSVIPVLTPAPAGLIAPAPTIQGALQNTVNALSQPKAEAAPILGQVFDGGVKLAEADVGGSLGAGAPSLGVASNEDLQAVAADSSKPAAERSAAVKQLAARGQKAALKAVGASNPEGGAADYEIKRQALRALAEQGEVVSLPAVSRAHADQILKDLSAKKPSLAVFDYDGTLEPWNQPATPETGAALAAAADQLSIAILTDRPNVQESINGFTPVQKVKLLIGENRGARVSIYEADGSATLVRHEPGWTPAQQTVIKAVTQKVAMTYGTGEFNGKTQDLSEYGFAHFLPVGTPAENVTAAASMMQAELKSLGIETQVVGRTAKKQTDPPYLTFSKIDKSLGVTILRRQASYLERLRAAPKALRKLVLRARQSELVDVKSTLLVGDHFFADRSIDSDMIKGAPGALAISVGAKADPRLDNVFVWPTEGPAATKEILAALATRGPTARAKPLVGMFSSAALSISAFLLTVIAYPFVAIPVVGVAGFGALMALGPLAAIATGPLNGMIAKKLSPRNATTVNTVVRTVLALALPAFAAAGILNFWTLLLASIANGWLLSSIMTSQNIYFRRFSGSHMGAVMATSTMKYFVLQVALGLIFGIGSYVDKWDPMVPYYISAAVHALLVLPIGWLTLPNEVEAAPASKTPEKSFSPRSFLQKYWKEAAILAGGLALFPLLGTTLPAAGALLWWISRTEAFKTLWGDKKLRYAMLFMSLGAMIFFPLQSFILPLMATTIAGAAGKGLLLGQMLGALFFGQLISNSSQAKLPPLNLPFVGKVNSQRLIQAFVLGLGATWFYVSLFPGSILAAAAAVAVGAGLMRLAGKMTDRGWMKSVGVGLSALLLPALAWSPWLSGTVPLMPVIFASLLFLGLFFGPGSLAISRYFFDNLPKGKAEEMSGVQASFFNGAVSMGYGLLTMLSSQLNPSLPPLLWILAPVFVLAGLLYTRTTKLLPEKPADKK